MVGPDNCPLFVNYFKDLENIPETQKYEDQFINRFEFQWFSKSNRTLKSNDVQAIYNSGDKLRLPLFIRKYNDERESDYFYMGDLKPKHIEEVLSGEENSTKKVKSVKIIFEMKNPVDESMYDYMTTPKAIKN